MRFSSILLSCLIVGFAAPTSAADDAKDDGFVPLFNGKDLTGWVNVNCHPDTFFVKEGMIVTTGKPTGFMRTEKQYENFIAEFEWMHVPPKPDAVGNSGFFVWGDPLPAVGSPFTRGIEVQVLVNLTYTDKKSGKVTASSHGDIFSIWGAKCVPDRPHPTGQARCIPSENRAKGANEWNHYRVEAKDGVIKLSVNGKQVSGVSQCSPRKGYLALESEGSECRFRNLKIKELPSSNPKAEQTAEVAKGFKNIFYGDLTGWKTGEGTKDVWTTSDWRLLNTGKGDKKKDLLSEKEYGDYEMIVDFRLPAAKGKEVADAKAGIVIADGKGERIAFEVGAGSFSIGHHTGNSGKGLGGPNGAKAGQWNRAVVTRRGGKVTVAVNGQKCVNETAFATPAKGSVGLLDTGAAVEYVNVFIRELKD